MGRGGRRERERGEREIFVSRKSRGKENGWFFSFYPLFLVFHPLLFGQFCRFLYYTGRILSVQLEYSSAFNKLTQVRPESVVDWIG